MSFILDALKRADAERAQGRVPGLHTQAIPAGGPAPALRQSANPYLLLLLGGVVIALLCLALWNWLKPGFAAPAALAAPPVPLATVATPAAAAPPPATPASTPLSAPSAPATQASPSTPSTNTVSALKIPIAAKTPARPTATAATAERPRERRAQPLVEAPTAPPANNPSPTLNELPESVRQALPKLVISGSIYSETAAHRMLIINGQVFREGEKPAPNLTLEQIKPKTAVFNFKGQRYSVGY